MSADPNFNPDEFAPEGKKESAEKKASRLKSDLAIIAELKSPKTTIKEIERSVTEGRIGEAYLRDIKLAVRSPQRITDEKGLWNIIEFLLSHIENIKREQ